MNDIYSVHSMHYIRKVVLTAIFTVTHQICETWIHQNAWRLRKVIWSIPFASV